MSTARLKAVFERWVAWPTDRPWTVLVGAGIIALLASHSVSRIRPSNSLGDLLGGQSDAAAALQRVMAHFAVADELLVLVTDEAPTGTTPAPHAPAGALLGFAAAFEAAVAASPEASAMCSKVRHRAEPEVLNFVRDRVVPAGLLYLNDEEFSALKDRLTLPAMKEQLRQDEAMIASPGPGAGALAKQLVRDPLRLREFLSARLGAMSALAGAGGSGGEFLSLDGRSLLIRVSGVHPASDLDFCTRLTAEVGRVVERVRPPGLRVELAGPYAIAAASAGAIRADSISNIIGDAVMMQLLFLVMYRRWSSFLMTMLPVCLGILVSFGLYGLLGRPLNPLTAVIAAVLAGLAADYCIHYLSHYDGVRPHATGVREAVRCTVADIGLPLLATGITTVHGFVAIAFSGARILRDFALLGALGLLCSLVASILMLPALLRLVERVSAPNVRRSQPMRPPRSAARFSLRPLIDAIARRPYRPLIGTAVLFTALAAVAVFGPRPSLDSDLSVMHPSPNPALDAQRRIATLFGGVADPLLIDFTAGSADELLTRAHAIDRAIRSPDTAATGVSGTFGLATLLPDPSARTNAAARFGLLDPDRVVADFARAVGDSAFDPDAFRGYSDFLRTMTAASQPPDLDTLRRYPALTAMLLATQQAGAAPAPDGPPRLEAVTYVFLDRPLDDRARRDAAVGAIRAALAGAGGGWDRESGGNRSRGEASGPTLTGVTVVGADVEALIRRDIPRVVAASVAAVLLTVLALFRRPADVALIFLPVGCSVAGVLAYMALSGERINLANLVAMPLLMGICVDYGIFAVGLARAAERERSAAHGTTHGNSDDGLAHRLGATGHAMLITGATTIIGFGTLVTTSTPAIRSLGRLVAVGIVACLVGTLFLLVPILILIQRRRSRTSALPPHHSAPSRS